MAWTAVYTYSAFEVLTAANLNTYISANTDYLKTEVDGLATYAIEVVIGDGIEVIPTSPAVKGYIEIPFAATITGWTIVGDASGSVVVDVWKDTYANFPPVNADSIAGSEKPTLSAAQKAQDLTLTTWTTAIAAGDWLAFEIESVATITQITLSLRLTRT